MTATFTYRSRFSCSVDDLYAYHSRPGALERLLPPWDGSEIVWKQGSIAPGGKVLMKLKQGILRIPWEAHHVEENPGKMFRDIQHKGPFAHFSHTHLFSTTDSGSQLEDHIEYALPGQRFMPSGLTRHIDAMLTRIFTHRENVLRDDLELHGRCSTRPLTILITGASGVLGSALIPLLTTGGHTVWTLVRRKPDNTQNEIYWDPQQGVLDCDALPEVDAVIHLAGEYIGLGRWTPEKKRRVIESRTRGTGLLATMLAQLPKPPRVFLSASAVGFYGDCGDTPVSEDHPEGRDFISHVCSVWENATVPARDAGIRTVLLRLGVGLTPKGGALQRLLSTRPVGFFRYFGTGDQIISWMSIDDMVSAMLHCLVTQSITGPINIAAPEPLSNRQFLATLSAVAKRSQLPPIPSKILQILYGQMASEIVLSSCRAETTKLAESGYRFRHPTLEHALSFLLGKY